LPEPKRHRPAEEKRAPCRSNAGTWCSAESMYMADTQRQSNEACDPVGIRKVGNLGTLVEIINLRRSTLRDMKALNQMGEPRIGAQRIHHRVGGQIADAISLIKGLIQPMKSFVRFAELTVN
jgi:hypothetical protein